jgi:hemerythrin-like domain-containing protein
MQRVIAMIGVEQLKRMHPSVRLGAADPLALLAQCHVKIGHQLDALERATEVLRAGSGGERLSAFFAIDMARALFDGPLIKHTEDEELSLFPRLRLAGSMAASEALAAVGELEAQHRTAERLHQDFARIVETLPRTCDAGERQIAHMGEVVAAICGFHRHHMRIEDEIVFPAAARVLSPEDLRRIAEEMRARRRVTLWRL